ncbi:hypothetical protein BCR36DRAFT_585144 [Piromyces finnis]|uniref:Uncharacterized protein n=1 Tax=Piromyces finnis TaxID=1754191 RepID=A0A1Y1V538_9FUNG|nr:hypothetical protein BCR36DRAFT_585144 [Piromyces finnis]|eukprot:ORX46680.1 hypothetical protein BCR36DRAFT_585144 [Piromyces finnis]
MDNFNNLSDIATSLQKIINSPIMIHSYNILSKFIDITSTVMDKIAERVNTYMATHGNSNTLLYKVHMESKNLFNVLPWPKIILIICITIMVIKIIQTTFSWVYKSVKFMMKSFIIAVTISIIVVWLIENGTERLALNMTNNVH